MANPQIVVEYVAKLDKFQKAQTQVGAQGSKAGAAIRKGLLPAAAALSAVAVYGNKAIDAASGLNEQIDASSVIFGRNAQSVQAWSKTLAASAGLSAREGLAAANAYGNMFRAVGLGGKATTGMSKAMVQLAGDMASFHDQDPSEMLEKLRSGLAGEAEPLRQFGVLISEAAVKQAAYENGIAKVGSELTEGQKVQARYALIMEKTTRQQGNFADTADSVANRQRTLAAENENTAATFGKALLPAMQAFQSVLGKVFGVLGKHPRLMQIMAAAVIVLAGAVMLANAAMAIAAVVTAAWLLPVLAVIAAVAALVAVGILVYKKWDVITAALSAAFERIKDAALSVIRWIRSNWPKIVAVLVGPMGIAVYLLIRYWDKLKSAARAAMGILSGILKLPYEAAKWVVGKIKAAFDGLLSFLRNFPAKVRNALAGVGNALKGPLNAVIQAWNDLRIPGFNVTIPGPGPVPDIHFGWPGLPLPDIPKLAAGGIVTAPTLAMLGEQGPEAIIPLGSGGIEVRVFIGETELRGIVQSEVLRSDSSTARMLIAGTP